MYSVTSRIKSITQPRGGYIKPSQFAEKEYNDNKILGTENLSPALVGTVVDYLTRFMIGTDVELAFRVPIQGYKRRTILISKAELEADKKTKVNIEYIISNITGLDTNSIIYACKAASYDIWYRDPLRAKLVSGADSVNPDEQTISNIKIMVERSITFFKDYGPVTSDGFTFEKDGYTDTVSSGDGDYLTADTLWDFKVSKNKLSKEQTLQILMYWIMGKHSGKEEFRNISKIGIFNPRLNKVYTLSTSEISSEIIKIIEDEVICY